MNSLLDVFEIMGLVTLIVVVAVLLSLPTALIYGWAIETGSWLLGLLAFAVFVLTVSVGFYIMSNLEAE